MLCTDSFPVVRESVNNYQMVGMFSRYLDPVRERTVLVRHIHFSVWCNEYSLWSVSALVVVHVSTCCYRDVETLLLQEVSGH